MIRRRVNEANVPTKKELIKKYVFYDFDEFEERKTRNQNGVSKKHLKIYYNGNVEKWYKENETNKNCFNCTKCVRCKGCKQCFDCENCVDCSYSHQCEDCKHCYNCIDVGNLTDENSVMNLD